MKAVCPPDNISFCELGEGLGLWIQGYTQINRENLSLGASIETGNISWRPPSGLCVLWPLFRHLHLCIHEAVPPVPSVQKRLAAWVVEAKYLKTGEQQEQGFLLLIPPCLLPSMHTHKQCREFPGGFYQVWRYEGEDQLWLCCFSPLHDICSHCTRLLCQHKAMKEAFTLSKAVLT